MHRLFTNGLLDVTVGRGGRSDCVTIAVGFVFIIKAASAGGSPGGSLPGMKLRFLHAWDLAVFSPDARSFNCEVSPMAQPLAGGGDTARIIVFDLPSPGLIFQDLCKKSGADRGDPAQLEQIVAIAIIPESETARQ